MITSFYMDGPGYRTSDKSFVVKKSYRATLTGIVFLLA